MCIHAYSYIYKHTYIGGSITFGGPGEVDMQMDVFIYVFIYIY
jgi:hypothetical protein